MLQAVGTNQITYLWWGKQHPALKKWIWWTVCQVYCLWLTLLSFTLVICPFSLWLFDHSMRKSFFAQIVFWFAEFSQNITRYCKDLHEFHNWSFSICQELPIVCLWIFWLSCMMCSVLQHSLIPVAHYWFSIVAFKFYNSLCMVCSHSIAMMRRLCLVMN